MWAALKEISKREKCTIHDICSLISTRKNQNTSLTAAIRVFLMLYFRASSTEEGHRRSGHGDFEHMKVRAKILLKPTMDTIEDAAEMGAQSKAMSEAVMVSESAV